MPYAYCLVLGLAIYSSTRASCSGPGPLDIRATAVLPLALVAFGQTLAIFTRGIDLSVGGILSAATALLATHFTAHGGALVGELLASS